MVRMDVPWSLFSRGWTASSAFSGPLGCVAASFGCKLVFADIGSPCMWAPCSVFGVWCFRVCTCSACCTLFCFFYGWLKSSTPLPGGAPASPCRGGPAGRGGTTRNRIEAASQRAVLEMLRSRSPCREFSAEGRRWGGARKVTTGAEATAQVS